MSISANQTALVLHFASCLYMTGVIWVMQLIHYPTFEKVEANQFSIFHKDHSKALGNIAGFGMTVEMLTAAWLALSGELFHLVSLYSVILLWILTFFQSVPLHNALSKQFNVLSCKKLVQTNWSRTAIWTIRSLVLTFYIASKFNF